MATHFVDDEMDKVAKRTFSRRRSSKKRKASTSQSRSDDNDVMFVGEFPVEKPAHGVEPLRPTEAQKAKNAANDILSAKCVAYLRMVINARVKEALEMKLPEEERRKLKAEEDPHARKFFEGEFRKRKVLRPTELDGNCFYASVLMAGLLYVPGFEGFNIAKLRNLVADELDRMTKIKGKRNLNVCLGEEEFGCLTVAAFAQMMYGGDDWEEEFIRKHLGEMRVFKRKHAEFATEVEVQMLSRILKGRVNLAILREDKKKQPFEIGEAFFYNFPDPRLTTIVVFQQFFKKGGEDTGHYEYLKPIPPIPEKYWK